jgi:hypothetical protein
MFIMHSCIFLVLILIAHNPLNDHNVFAESPSFSIQEINSGIHNGIQIDGLTHAQTKPDYKGLLDSSSDIQRVTYFSDGKTLNATMWLGGGFSKTHLLTEHPQQFMVN